MEVMEEYKLKREKIQVKIIIINSPLFHGVPYLLSLWCYGFWYTKKKETGLLHSIVPIIHPSRHAHGTEYLFDNNNNNNNNNNNDLPSPSPS